MSMAPESPLRPLVAGFFEAQPQARDEVMRAWFAYHCRHFREHPGAHHFAGGQREAKCRWCGRSRELVRWDDLPATCQARPDVPEVADVIAGEEARAFALIARAERDVPRLIAKHGLSGETLARLHHTHGFDPAAVALAVDVPAAVLADYEAAMDRERARSKAAHVAEVITLAGANA